MYALQLAFVIPKEEETDARSTFDQSPMAVVPFVSILINLYDVMCPPVEEMVNGTFIVPE